MVQKVVFTGLEKNITKSKGNNRPGRPRKNVVNQQSQEDDKFITKSMLTSSSATSTLSPSSCSLSSSSQFTFSPSSCLPNSTTSTNGLSSSSENESDKSPKTQQSSDAIMQSFVNYFERHPQLTSTPVKVIRNASTHKTQSKHLRFSPSLEECRYFSDDDVIQVDGKSSHFKSSQKTSMLKQAPTISTLPVRDFQKFIEWTEEQQMKNDKSNDINQNITNDNRVRDLINLQNTLSFLKDRKIMKEIIRIIKRAGYLQVKETTYDFDLYTMDEITVESIRRCLC